MESISPALPTFTFAQFCMVILAIGAVTAVIVKMLSPWKKQVEQVEALERKTKDLDKRFCELEKSMNQRFDANQNERLKVIKDWNDETNSVKETLSYLMLAEVRIMDYMLNDTDKTKLQETKDQLEEKFLTKS